MANLTWGNNTLNNIHLPKDWLSQKVSNRTTRFKPDTVNVKASNCQDFHESIYMKSMIPSKISSNAADNIVYNFASDIQDRKSIINGFLNYIYNNPSDILKEFNTGSFNTTSEYGGTRAGTGNNAYPGGSSSYTMSMSMYAAKAPDDKYLVQIADKDNRKLVESVYKSKQPDDEIISAMNKKSGLTGHDLAVMQQKNSNDASKESSGYLHPTLRTCHEFKFTGKGKFIGLLSGMNTAGATYHYFTVTAHTTALIYNSSFYKSRGFGIAQRIASFVNNAYNILFKNMQKSSNSNVCTFKLTEKQAETLFGKGNSNRPASMTLVSPGSGSSYYLLEVKDSADNIRRKLNQFAFDMYDAYALHYFDILASNANSNGRQGMEVDRANRSFTVKLFAVNMTILRKGAPNGYFSREFLEGKFTGNNEAKKIADEIKKEMAGSKDYDSTKGIKVTAVDINANNGKPMVTGGTIESHYDEKSIVDGSNDYTQAAKDLLDKAYDDGDLNPNSNTSTEEQAGYGTFRYMNLDNSYMGLGEAFLSSISTPAATYGIGGMPASYLPTTDPPLWEGHQTTSLGFVYMNHYIRYGQFIAFRPCIASWATTITQDLELAAEEGISSSASALIGQIASGTLASLYPNTYEYWMQVSRSCRVAVHLMGIENEYLTFESGPIKKNDTERHLLWKTGYNYDRKNIYKFGDMRLNVWSMIGSAFAQIIGNSAPATSDYDFSEQLLDKKLSEEQLKQLYNGDPGYPTDGKDEEKQVGDLGVPDHGIVPFLVNGNIEMSDSYQNTPEESSVAKVFQQTVGDSQKAIKELVRHVISRNPTGSVSSIAQYITGTYMTPKVWGGSNYDRNVTVNFLFSSDAGDPVSSFMNCIFPTIKLYNLALAQATGGLLFPPFLVNVYSRGVVNIDWGLITNISVTKSMTTCNDLGMPTELQVSVSIQDLKPFLFMEKPKWWSFTSKVSGSFNNMMATLVGQNVTTIPYNKKLQFQRKMAALNWKEQSDQLGTSIVLGISRTIERFSIYIQKTWYGGVVDKITATGAVLGVSGNNLFGKGNSYNGNK